MCQHRIKECDEIAWIGNTVMTEILMNSYVWFYNHGKWSFHINPSLPRSTVGLSTNCCIHFICTQKEEVWGLTEENKDCRVEEMYNKGIQKCSEQGICRWQWTKSMQNRFLTAAGKDKSSKAKKPEKELSEIEICN